MAAVTALGTTFTTAAGAKSVTTTPAVGDLIVIIACHTGLNSSDAPTDNQSGTYTQVTFCGWGTNGTGRMTFWLRNSLIASAVSTIFTHDPTPTGSSNGGGLSVLKVTGMSRTGSSAARNSTGGVTFAAAATPSATLSSVLTTNPVIGGVLNATSPASLTPRTGYSELADVGYSTPTAGMEIMARDSGETSTTIAWGGTSASAGGVLAVELDASAAATPSAPYARNTLLPLLVR